MVRQGDILFIDLNPTKGNEMAKKVLEDDESLRG